MATPNYYELEHHYSFALEYYNYREYERAYNLSQKIVSEIMEGLDSVKVTRNIARVGGWVAAFLTGGLGLEDIIIVPVVTKIIMSLFGVDLDKLMDLLERATYLGLSCSIARPSIMAQVSTQLMLRDFLILYKLSNNRNDDTWLKSILRLISPFEEGRIEGNEHWLHLSNLLEELYQEARKPVPETAAYGNLLLLYLHAFGLKNNHLYQFLLFGREDIIRDYDDANTNTSGSYQNSGRSSGSAASSHYYDPMENYYGGVLGLNGDFSKENIKKKYREKMKANHPDVNARNGKGSEEKAKKINEAYEYFKRKYSFS
ncbi:MAG: J domain-containing protein [Ignavibacteriales bacterium]|nr:MAG: J domain-containing protein [Ignavibacteriaceae bacterium]MBW7873150.1 J domain-containing protein [Ignavibacteria bacterium]MCZ2142792.1 J domain-containing protein [Ignavibacteriales bacterium]OQY69798.1 MAG: hypothetical protein B6D45_12245 [Ignavibacteriales bacterium UTCHB3]MBV6443886.1 Chaperone protein DnaJ [Ignavibacteriaceae bacterium]